MTPEAKAPREIRVLGTPFLRPFSKRQLRVGALLFTAYLATTRIGSAFFVAPAVVFPGAGIAMGALFLEGLFLWPFVYSASFVGYVFDGATLATLLIMPVAHTLQALVGAYILRRLKVDPIFRRSRDVFSVIVVALVSTLIVPTLAQFADIVNTRLYGVPFSSVTWFSWWTGLVLAVLVITPFVMRWFAKPHFTRTLAEFLEVVLALSGVVIISYFMFWTKIDSFWGVLLGYVLMFPFLWIALRPRMGPRFLSLAILLLSLIAIPGTFFGAGSMPGDTLGEQLFSTELLLIVMTVIFFSIVTIEEERRMATKLLTSQLGTLHQTLDQLAEQDKAKNEFVALVAHELRNPLAPVVASLDLLKERMRDAESLRTLSFMESCMVTARRLLEDLLDVSRASHQKLVLKKEPIDIRKAVRQAAASRTHTLIERDQKFTLSLPSHPVFVDADSVRIEQIVMNLLVNASKFTPPHGSISLSLLEEHGRAILTLKDTGVGIESSVLERIFEPFEQAGGEGDHAKKGLGIGLTLARELVTAHGGTIRAESAGKGHGSSFVVELPTTTPKPALAGAMKEPSSELMRGTVLVVDDNDSSAYAIGRLLELMGYRVEYAYDGTHAFERALEVRPDVILLDIGLPDIDGYEVARTLRESGYTQKLVALTGYSSDEDRQKALSVGFDHHLVKPVGIAELRRVLS